MLPRRDEPFPLAACRDLLGVVRALYRATPADERVRRQRLERIGRSLSMALALASSPAGSVGHRAAWQRAEDAVRDLGDLIQLFEQARPVVEAAGLAVVGGRPASKRPKAER